MTDEKEAKRDLVLPPGTYAFMQDLSKGNIKTYTGPTTITPTSQERPVVYDPEKGAFRTCRLEEALRTSAIAPEGYYINLKNPAKKAAAEHPAEGTSQNAADLDVGRKINIPGPCMFALWPGQDATLIRGHNLRFNQYLLVRVYNEEESRKNWTRAVVRTVTPGSKEGDAPPPPVDPVATAAAPTDLSVGRLFVIKGTEVSFYIPPTGVAVVAEGSGLAPGSRTLENTTSKEKYVRDALTLERLEYCILVDEDGNKRYERGPQVVFPKPTERFIEGNNEKGATTRKFRAIELNDIQGLHIKVIADYTEGGKTYKAGQELFITGKDTAIYFPREEHSLVSYDGRSKHFAVAVPAGEGRYVMDRLSGQIAMEQGPKMLLPDPRHEVIVRRALSDKQVVLWYPGNEEALEYNRAVRQILANVPTTRQGAVSEGDVKRGLASTKYRTLGTGDEIGAAMMQASAVSNAAPAKAGDEFSRSSTYTQPRTVTLQTKYEGVPGIQVWTGYAVMVVSKTGTRKPEIGPKNVLLQYDESLEVLELSTGRPKTTDKLFKTVYLRILNNKIGDLVQNLETKDHVMLDARLSLRVSFTGEPSKWFDVENYVKFLCDHVRSVLKGAVKKLTVEDFYNRSVDVIRDTILGKADPEGGRPGMLFEENGMHVTDVEVLEVQITDKAVAALLAQSQHNVVKDNIALAEARRVLDTTKETERINREKAEEKNQTIEHSLELQTKVLAAQAVFTKDALDKEKQEQEQRAVVAVAREAVMDVTHTAKLARDQEAADTINGIAEKEQGLRIAMIEAEVDAVVKRFAAAQPGFAEALKSLANDEVLVKVAQAWSIQRVIGGDNVADALRKVFEGTPLGPVVGKLLTNGNGQAKPAVTPTLPTS